MANDWILDVLSDLKAFALQNGLSETAEQLDDAALVAALEISSTEGRRAQGALLHERTVGHVY